ncbi:hypothetical protein [Anaeromicropila herbilytica]|uniref:Uncharacterized protein n=1 Tax=Anaeromicropila herbilytica TaxID=2785025 RepID=A0A7R7EPS5_9FIRM|nr:hypothetical protein [Anaeromicropila herbilytica]BCN32551.1 hypothetical protein bsdtb5_38460 [Anaeromicropila herbilytica]
MATVRKTIEDSLKLIDEITEHLYKQEVTLGYQKLNTAITTITEAINLIFEYKKINPDFELDEKKIVDTFTEALNAMEAKDIILLADILQYEITEQFNEILEQIHE